MLNEDQLTAIVAATFLATGGHSPFVDLQEVVRASRALINACQHDHPTLAGHTLQSYTEKVFGPKAESPQG